MAIEEGFPGTTTAPLCGDVDGQIHDLLMGVEPMLPEMVSRFSILSFHFNSNLGFS
jgi:hypothetical protein